MPDEMSGTDVMEDGLNAGTQSVGTGMREVRERLGWKLPDVAESLRIRPEFLQAIEAGDLEALPGAAYRTGFVRTYARTLGLDPDEILRRFRAEGGLHDAAAKTETRFITNVPDSGVPKGAAVMVGVVLLLAGYGLWYHYSGAQRRLAEQVPAVPAQLAPLATPPKLEVAPVTPAPAPATPSAAIPSVNPATTPADSGATTATATPVVPTPAPPAPGAGMVISATQDAWVEVHDPAGNILFSKVLHPGESWPVPQEAGLILTTGNAGGTIITTNGVAAAPLGAPSAVLHNYQLTPAVGSASTSAAAPAASIVAPATTAPAVTAPATPAPPATANTTSAAGGGKKSQAAPSGTP
jgi:cytoskeleton protein RodZ